MADITNKQVKLQSRSRSSSSGEKTVPWLTISGAWLERLGFKAGDTLRLTAREKLLIIEPLEDDSLDYKAAL